MGVKQRSDCSWNHWSSNTTSRLSQRQWSNQCRKTEELSSALQIVVVLRKLPNDKNTRMNGNVTKTLSGSDTASFHPCKRTLGKTPQGMDLDCTFSRVKTDTYEQISRSFQHCESPVSLCNLHDSVFGLVPGSSHVTFLGMNSTYTVLLVWGGTFRVTRGYIHIWWQYFLTNAPRTITQCYVATWLEDTTGFNTIDISQDFFFTWSGFLVRSCKISGIHVTWMNSLTALFKSTHF